MQIDSLRVGVVCRFRDQDFQQELAALVERDRERHSIHPLPRLPVGGRMSAGGTDAAATSPRLAFVIGVDDIRQSRFRKALKSPAAGMV
jgi:hypothetical protein